MTPLPLGRIDVADFARRALAEVDSGVKRFLERHQRGDWGEVDAIGRAHNDYAASHDLDGTSYYRLTTGMILTITTKYDRAMTRVALFSAA